jgi:hypothetical protein
MLFAAKASMSLVFASGVVPSRLKISAWKIAGEELGKLNLPLFDLVSVISVLLGCSKSFVLGCNNDKGLERFRSSKNPLDFFVSLADYRLDRTQSNY